MKLTRKDFLKTGALFTGGLLLPGFKFFNPFQEQSYKFTTIRNNIGIFTERGGTIGWYASNDGLVVIDSQYPETAKNLLEGLKQRSPRKIDILFNTHHHGDHTAGNLFLKDYANKIVAHENCKALQEKNYGGNPEKPQVYPSAIFTSTWGEDIGKEKVVARYFGPAHTGGDSVVHFEKSNIAHMGDLVFNKTFPFIDPNGGGSIQQWAVTLEKILKYYDNDTTFIFGHSIADEFLIGSKKDVSNMRDYLTSLIEFVSGEIKKGGSKEEIAAAASIPGFEEMKERWQGARKMNLERAYDELSSK
ncbi:MAG TPA: MBL fold metallo-hydrolase [Melioribacteraceae bacterium]|nr:MBL fold metallo-hydrolase [Melioribacteraceae bacterium]